MNGHAPGRPAHRRVAIVENVRIARDTYRLRLHDPAMARAIRPGQFLMVRPTLPGSTDPFFGRPFALYDTVPDASGMPEALDVVYLVIGRGTASMAERRPGDRLEVWGPLGNGFGPPPDGGGPVAFVAGGIGQTPFLALGRDWLGGRSYGEGSAGRSGPPASSATMFYGVRSADLLAGLDDFRAAGIDVETATDDGSAGHVGFVTELLERRLAAGFRPSVLVGCGPPPMLARLSRIAERAGLPSVVSLENQMACGFGACYSCVVPIREADGATDLRRACVEGPIFDAARVAWD